MNAYLEPGVFLFHILPICLGDLSFPFCSLSRYLGLSTSVFCLLHRAKGGLQQRRITCRQNKLSEPTAPMREERHRESCSATTALHMRKYDQPCGPPLPARPQSPWPSAPVPQPCATQTSIKGNGNDDDGGDGEGEGDGDDRDGNSDADDWNED